MSEASEPAGAHHSEQFTIVVDTVEHGVHDAHVTWKEVVEIAYPEQSEDQQYVFKVQYEGAASEPRAGTLVKGGHIEVRKSGTVFSVLRSLVS